MGVLESPRPPDGKKVARHVILGANCLEEKSAALHHGHQRRGTQACSDAGRRIWSSPSDPAGPSETNILSFATPGRGESHAHFNQLQKVAGALDRQIERKTA